MYYPIKLFYYFFLICNVTSPSIFYSWSSPFVRIPKQNIGPIAFKYVLLIAVELRNSHGKIDESDLLNYLFCFQKTTFCVQSTLRSYSRLDSRPYDRHRDDSRGPPALRGPGATPPSLALTQQEGVRAAGRLVSGRSQVGLVGAGGPTPWRRL